jgi:hypothetical protein
VWTGLAIHRGITRGNPILQRTSDHNTYMKGNSLEIGNHLPRGDVSTTYNLLCTGMVNDGEKG